MAVLSLRKSGSLFSKRMWALQNLGSNLDIFSKGFIHFLTEAITSSFGIKQPVCNRSVKLKDIRNIRPVTCNATGGFHECTHSLSHSSLNSERRVKCYHAFSRKQKTMCASMLFKMNKQYVFFVLFFKKQLFFFSHFPYRLLQLDLPAPRQCLALPRGIQTLNANPHPGVSFTVW